MQGWYQRPAVFPPLTCHAAGLEAPACCQDPVHLLPALTPGRGASGAGAGRVGRGGSSGFHPCVIQAIGGLSGNGVGATAAGGV